MNLYIYREIFTIYSQNFLLTLLAYEHTHQEKWASLIQIAIVKYVRKKKKSKRRERQSRLSDIQFNTIYTPLWALLLLLYSSPLLLIYIYTYTLSCSSAQWHTQCERAHCVLAARYKSVLLNEIERFRSKYHFRFARVYVYHTHTHSYCGVFKSEPGAFTEVELDVSHTGRFIVV